jgi:hypothetical protein
MNRIFIRYILSIRCHIYGSYHPIFLQFSPWPTHQPGVLATNRGILRLRLRMTGHLFVALSHYISFDLLPKYSCLLRKKGFGQALKLGGVALALG